MFTRGLTLIELIVVVAIIAILAIIAVPNFLEAQTRAKVSRAKADLHTFAQALNSYAIDHNAYPFPFTTMMFRDSLRNVFELTTPVAYVSSVDRTDVFDPLWNPDDGPKPPNWKTSYNYNSYSGFYGKHFANLDSTYHIFKGYSLISVGPNRKIDGMAIVPFLIQRGLPGDGLNIIYDPTNGTTSGGDIGLWTGQPAIYGSF